MTTKRKAFVLLSGGLDSTTCLYQAIHDYAPFEYEPGEIKHRLKPENDDPLTIDWVQAISINYGQRHLKEATYARQTCLHLGIKHKVIPIGDLLGKSMLTDKSIEVPNISYSDIKGVSPTYVPNRNMTMLSVLTAQAALWIKSEEESSGLRCEAGVYFGAHAEDAQNWAYPDCTPEFIGAMANAIHVATYFKVRLHTPLMWLMKKDIVELGTKLGAPFENTWSCYKGEELHCGICPTCRSRREAFVAAQIFDPTQYAATA